MNRSLRFSRGERFAQSAYGQEKVDCPQCKGSGEVSDPWHVPDPNADSPYADLMECGGCVGKGHVSRWWASRYRKEWW